MFAGQSNTLYYCATDGITPLRGSGENTIVSIYDVSSRNVPEAGYTGASGGVTTMSATLWDITGAGGVRFYQNTKAAVQLIDCTIQTTGACIDMTTMGNNIILGNVTTLTSSAGYGVNLALTNAGSNSWDSGAFNNLRVGASATISGFAADINLGDSATSLTALRTLPGKVLVGATTLNRAVSF